MRAPSEIPPESLLGGKYRLIQRIGKGGMGFVWVARNEATQAEVAVKTLARTERTSAHDERFRREARLAATVSHRNVVRIFDLVDDADGTLGLVMELLRGGTLENTMRERGPMSTIHAIAVIAPILSALHHVHQKGIVHRDVKPANVFFAVEPDGHVIPKILDFGIAKVPTAGSALTVDGSVLGTPHYMSPEQIRGQELDGRSDMFSVAVVLYEMLTGVRPFQRDSAAASLAAVLEHEVDPDPRIEPRVWLALNRALAKRAYERFATAGELADALRAAVDATEEDLQASLQELRPRGDVTPAELRPSPIATPAPRVETVAGVPVQRPLGRVIGIAAGLAVAVVVVAFLLARFAAPAGADAKPASSATSLASAALPPPPVTAAPVTAVDVPAATAPPVTTPVARPTTAPAPRPHASGTARPKATGSKPGIATSPGF